MGKTHLATALGYAACQHVNGDAAVPSRRPRSASSSRRDDHHEGPSYRMKDRKEAGISFEDRLSSLENYVVHASATLAKLNARYKRVRTSNSCSPGVTIGTNLAQPESRPQRNSNGHSSARCHLRSRTIQPGLKAGRFGFVSSRCRPSRCPATGCRAVWLVPRVRETALSQSFPVAYRSDPAAVVLRVSVGAPLDALAATDVPIPLVPWTQMT